MTAEKISLCLGEVILFSKTSPLPFNVRYQNGSSFIPGKQKNRFFAPDTFDFLVAVLLHSEQN
jgi:hypothetical protein